jgi:Protein of unknown function (DUF3263)
MERADRDVGGVPDPQESEPEPELTEQERAILDFEKQWWRRPGAKEQAIREAFDLSPTRYYQLLNALIDRPAAVAYDPGLINRLRRMRSSRPHRP